MTPSQVGYMALIALVGLERLVELRLSRRNAEWAFANGGVEYGQAHFRWMKLLHTGLLLAAPLEVILLGRAFVPALGGAALALVILCQALRYWAITTLGRYWNVRVIVVPGSAPVCRGPYGWVRHPNYLAVILEGLALPLVHGAWLTATVFTVLNAWLLAVRIHCEEAALERHTHVPRAGRAPRSRFLPTPRRS